MALAAYTGISNPREAQHYWGRLKGSLRRPEPLCPGGRVSNERLLEGVLLQMRPRSIDFGLVARQNNNIKEASAARRWRRLKEALGYDNVRV
jgi:hypothetical protein